MNVLVQKPIFWVAVAAALALATKSPALALCLGGAISLLWGNPIQKRIGRMSKHLLQLAVILLGFGLPFHIVLKVGYASVGVTFVSITGTLLLGWALGRVFRVNRDLSLLLSSGTAICGGSAIAAMAPVIGAPPACTALAMAVVFLLNGVALLVFPFAGHLLGLSQNDFGVWSALAIHDTSSVVGATAAFGAQALAVGTTVKLTRALWILPVSFLGARIRRSESGAKVPWFLLAFLATAMLRSSLPAMDGVWDGLALGGKRMMVATLFLVGAGLARADLRRLGGGPMIKAVVLWIVVAALSLGAILLGWCRIEMPV
ncbi:MAG: putative sulfate exporter family transporter [Planctomycetota bacterium]